MKTSYYKFIGFIMLALQSCIAYAESIKLSSVETPFGIKVYLENLSIDYILTNSDGILTLTFNEDMEYEDLGMLPKSGNMIRNVIPQKRSLNIFFKSNDVFVDKFQEGKKVGFNIHDTEIEKKIKVEQDKINKVHDVEVTIMDSNDSKKVLFNWDCDVGSVVYERNHKLWIIFNEKANFIVKDPSNLPSLKQEVIDSEGSFVSLNLDDLTKNFQNILAYREGLHWVIELSNKNVKPHEIKVIPRPYAAPVPRVELEFDSKALEPIKFIDPQIGDHLTALPSLNAAYAVSSEYKFVDFKVFKTYQGAIMQVLSDSIDVKNVDQYVYIKGVSALNIAAKVNRKVDSNSDNKIDNYKFKDVTLSKSILNLKSFYLDSESIVKRLNEIQHSISIAENSETRCKMYNTLALFYLANEFTQEASIALKLLKQENLDFANSYNIKLLEAAIAFKNSDFLEAYKIIKNIDITDVSVLQRKEIRFWQAVISYKVGNTNDFLNSSEPTKFYINDDNTFLKEYTSSFQLDFGIAIANYKIKNKEFADAKSIIDKLESLDFKGHNFNRALILKADYHSAKDEQTEAISNWDKCIEDCNDQLNWAQCKFKKTEFLHDHDLISQQNYIDELENISLLWRGDNLEVNTLKNLGDAYFDIKDYINSLRSWKKIIDNYPFSPDALALAHKIGETFVNFFINGMDKEVSHLQAVAIFYEFDDLVPVGVLGDDVVIRFSDHLIALDLLDKAAALLNHQIVNRLKGYKREIAINKLAKVYILNQRPELSIDIINSGDFYEELPQDIALERKYINATAFYENEEYVQALKLLKDDFSPDADNIKAEIYWRKRDWVELNKYLEPRIYEIRYDNETLKPQDAVKVLKLLISYLLLDEKKLARNLITDFKLRMPINDDNSNVLDSLCNTWKVMNDNSLSGLRDLNAIEIKIKELIKFFNKRTS